MCRALLPFGVGGCFILLAAMMVRADDLSRTIRAQQHLKSLGVALNGYLGGGGERLDDPIRLWEYGDVQDPLVFWHPGDDDPPPTTIDNSIPNAPNSARISFEFLTGDLDGVGDHPIIWDNSSSYNGGTFISYWTRDGEIEVDPPNASPVPTDVAVTQAHLSRLWWAMLRTARDSQGQLPRRLYPVYYNCPRISARNFWNPGDADPMPTIITSDTPNGPFSARISFDFLVPGQVWDDIPGDTIILADNSVDNNEGYGVNVLNRWGFTRFVPVATFGDYTRDKRIDMMDFAGFQNCFTGWPGGQIIELPCRILDWNSDNHISVWSDHENFVTGLVGPAH